MPTYSALDVETVTSATAYARYVNNVTDSPSPSRVLSYIAQENVNGTGTQFNQPHLRFTARNSEWIYNQMQGLPPASNYCSTECLPLTINSSLPTGQRLCAGNSITLTIPGLATGTMVNWTTAPAGFFTTTSGSGPTFTTTATAGGAGTGTITATVGPCNNTVSVNVPVGAGEPSGRYVVGAYFSGAGTPLQTNNPAGPDKVNIIVDAPYNFTFTASPSSVSVTALGGGQASFYMPAGGGGVTITATAINATSGCGVVGHWTFFPAPYHMVVTPNPASTELTVWTTDPASSAAPAARTAAAMSSTADPVPFDADLYNAFGKKVKTKRSERGKAVLDVRDLPAGLYVMRVGQGKNALSENIQITH
ncbi:T9SS type A sorting domain-containing protein [Hymenobacter arcticus]